VHQRVTQGGGVKEASLTISCNSGNVGRNSNSVVMVDVKENVGQGLMMSNTKLLEAWVSSGKANLVSGKANLVTRVSQMCSSYPKLSGSDQGYLKVTLA
jgi:hypothetical protein